MGNNLAVLVVDDEPQVRAVAVEMFESLGFDVFDTWSGERALALLRDHPEIDFLFSDVKMPGMDGVSLADRARKMRPGLRVVLTSGYVGHIAQPDLPFVRKPWRKADLEALSELPRG